ncbi:pantoate--beta-alanine ligase [Gynurincola endophyticus]|uniref:pantoate--beta-alanine ligase n=1 Tax=Gynurincola endophyticus TaxID=2479004 RepID=UPI000F8CA912|nr:pantoate--beta-alanine ligase [Gynurincola endophyticus]
MIIFKEIDALQSFLAGKDEIGFVPTMGALHTGHLTLLQESLKHSKLTICSIFVNPTQFNDPRDFEKYPITLEKDIELLTNAGVDAVFVPTVATIYPAGLNKLETYPLGSLEKLWEGSYRPGHFQGVCQVVSRLLDAVQPHKIYMGQKDFQQCMVIKKLIELKNISTELIQVATVRETSGLAMSSRNMRLSATEKTTAVTISQVLDYLRDHINILPISLLLQEAQNRLMQAGFKVDYVGIADASTLEPIVQIDPKRDAVAMIAAYLNEVRLIDNKLIYTALQ